MKDYYLITFESTHGAIASQKYLEKTMKIVIMPTLREISNSCGISIRVQPENYKEAAEKMEKFTVKDYHIYSIQGKEIIKLK